MIERYSRLLELSSFSKEKLDVLLSKKVLIIGVGGVGQSVALFLLTNGVNNLTLIDYDKVEISNLNRQILLSENDVGKSKVEVVKRELLRRNSDAQIEIKEMKINESNIFDIIYGYDLVVDAVDNWKSKLVISESCHKANIPFIHVGVDGEKGQCCLFKNKSLKDIVDEDILSAHRDGVMGPMVSLIASLASIKIIEYFTLEKVETDTLYFYDNKSTHLGKMKI